MKIIRAVWKRKTACRIAKLLNTYCSRNRVLALLQSRILKGRFERFLEYRCWSTRVPTWLAYRMKNEDIASVFSLAYCVLKCCQTVSGDLVHTFLSTPPLRKLSVNLNQEDRNRRIRWFLLEKVSKVIGTAKPVVFKVDERCQMICGARLSGRYAKTCFHSIPQSWIILWNHRIVQRSKIVGSLQIVWP